MPEVLRIEDVWKEYRLGVFGHGMLFRDIQSWWSRMRRREDPNVKIREVRNAANHNGESIWALREVGFDVHEGEVVGIIGKNGAGKSTLLKIISKVTAPTRGQVKIKGRVASLLEVGTGFHPELTGRENIYLNGAILGMSIRDTKKRFDEIVEFSGVGKYIDTPVKRYSSGMYVRLAFAVAAHLEPDILLVDEVLAVGDAEFQKKCIGKMAHVSKLGRTVLFVSHNLGAIKKLCRRAVIIHNGQLVEDGDPMIVTSKYIEMTTFQASVFSRIEGEHLTIEKVDLLNGDGNVANEFAPGSSLTVRIHYRAHSAIARPYFFVSLSHPHGGAFIASMLFDDFRPARLQESGSLSCTFPSLPLLPQLYTITIGIRKEDGVTQLIPSQEVAYFTVTGSMKEAGFNAPMADSIVAHSIPVITPYEWQLPDGRVGRFQVKSMHWETLADEPR
jgi:lipopolysaccharide transport system ATP-binding protein